jgi:hypothetical protein
MIGVDSVPCGSLARVSTRQVRFDFCKMGPCALCHRHAVVVFAVGDGAGRQPISALRRAPSIAIINRAPVIARPAILHSSSLESDMLASLRRLSLNRRSFSDHPNTGENMPFFQQSSPGLALYEVRCVASIMCRGAVVSLFASGGLPPPEENWSNGAFIVHLQPHFAGSSGRGEEAGQGNWIL